MKPKHYCKAVDDPKANIRCVSFIDNDEWFALYWIDESSLLVKWCPFCGQHAESYKEKEMNNGMD